MGFTLPELRRILNVRDKGDVPCRQVLMLAKQKLGELEAQLIEMQTTRDRMAELINDWEKRVEQTPEGVRSRLLEGLARAQTAPPLKYPRAFQQRKQRSKSI